MTNRYVLVCERSFGDVIQHTEEYEGDDYKDANSRIFKRMFELEDQRPDLVFRIDLEKTETIYRTE